MAPVGTPHFIQLIVIFELQYSTASGGRVLFAQSRNRVDPGYTGSAVTADRTPKARSMSTARPAEGDVQ